MNPNLARRKEQQRDTKRHGTKTTCLVSYIRQEGGPNGRRLATDFFSKDAPKPDQTRVPESGLPLHPPVKSQESLIGTTALWGNRKAHSRVLLAGLLKSFIMKLFDRTIIAVFLGFGLTLGGAAPVSAAGNGGFQYYRDPATSSNLRVLVDRAQSDLRVAADLDHAKEDQRKRYSDAQGHLSTFDRKLTKGKFDKGELNKSIDKIKQILDKNVLQARMRDALMRDITDLRMVRDRRE